MCTILTDNLLIADISPPEQVPIPNGVEMFDLTLTSINNRFFFFFWTEMGLEKLQVIVFTQFNSLDKVELTVEKEMSLANFRS